MITVMAAVGRFLRCSAGTLTMRCQTTCRAPAPTRRIRRPARWRQATARALLAVLVTLLLAPGLEAAAAGDDGRCCRRGVCCHHRTASETTCIRDLCPCGGHDGGPTAAPGPHDAVLPRVSEPWAGLSATGARRDPAACPERVDLPPPYRPPRPSL